MTRVSDLLSSSSLTLSDREQPIAPTIAYDVWESPRGFIGQQLNMMLRHWRSYLVASGVDAALAPSWGIDMKSLFIALHAAILFDQCHLLRMLRQEMKNKDRHDNTVLEQVVGING